MIDFADFEDADVTVSFLPRAAGAHWVDSRLVVSLKAAIEAVREDGGQHRCLVLVHAPAGDIELSSDQVDGLMKQLGD